MNSNKLITDIIKSLYETKEDQETSEDSILSSEEEVSESPDLDEPVTLQNKLVKSSIKRKFLNYNIINILYSYGIQHVSAEDLVWGIELFRNKFPELPENGESLLNKERLTEELNISLPRLIEMFWLISSLYSKTLELIKTSSDNKLNISHLSRLIYSYASLTPSSLNNARFFLLSIYDSTSNEDLEYKISSLETPKRQDNFAEIFKYILELRTGETISEGIQKFHKPSSVSLDFIHDTYLEALTYQLLSSIVLYYAKATETSLPSIDLNIIKGATNPYIIFEKTIFYSALSSAKFIQTDADQEEILDTLPQTTEESETEILSKLYGPGVAEKYHLDLNEVNFIRTANNILAEYFPNASFALLAKEFIDVWNSQNKWPIILADETDLHTLPLFLWLENLEEYKLFGRESINMPEATFIDILNNSVLSNSEEYTKTAIKEFIDTWDTDRFTIKNTEILEKIRKQYLPQMLSGKISRAAASKLIKTNTSIEPERENEIKIKLIKNQIWNNAIVFIRNFGSIILSNTNISTPQEFINWVNTTNLAEINQQFDSIFNDEIVGTKSSFLNLTKRAQTAIENIYTDIQALKSEPLKESTEIPFNATLLKEAFFNAFISTNIEYAPRIINDFKQLLLFTISYAEDPTRYEVIDPNYKGEAQKFRLRNKLLEPEDYKHLLDLYFKNKDNIITTKKVPTEALENLAKLKGAIQNLPQKYEKEKKEILNTFKFYELSGGTKLKALQNTLKKYDYLLTNLFGKSDGLSEFLLNFIQGNFTGQQKIAPSKKELEKQIKTIKSSSESESETRKRNYLPIPEIEL